MSIREYGNVPHGNDHGLTRVDSDRYHNELFGGPAAHNGLFGGPAADLYGTHEGSSNEGDYPRAAPDTSDEPDRHASPFGSMVRPYTRTRGRTKPNYELALEALVFTSERGRDRELVEIPEHRSICSLCVDARSIAEVAALLRLPLGVVRILIGDMASMGLVVIHQGGLVAHGRSPQDFLERVLSGLRRL